ncbi:MAG: OmpA family protein [Porticoccaceae bacterium]
MKALNSLLGALVVFTSGAALASDNWYLGMTASNYNLDSERALVSDIEGSQVGLQVGKNINDSLAIELGYGANVGNDDFDVASLNGVLWLTDPAATWRPYVLLGINRYDFNEASNLAAGHDDNSRQLIFGLGVGTMLTDHYQLRADVRGMGGLDEEAEDVGFQLSINRSFGSTTVRQPVTLPAVEQQPEMRAVTISLNVQFEFNKATVLAVYGEQLQSIASAMRVHSDIELVLEGHTDSRGSDAYNIDLSSRRAAAVKQKLADDYGIDADRISSVGYGESRPIASNQTKEGRARNRRVVGEMSFTEVVVD